MAIFSSSERSALPREVAEERFAELYAEYGRDVLAYALPRTAGVDDASEVVADTFMVAWRRWADVPSGPEARLWLFGVARRVAANQRRGAGRRTRLAELLRSELAAAPAEHAAVPGFEGEEVLAALGRVSAEDRELLLLAGWEELGSAEIARVLGISTPAARTRLHRARHRLRKELSAAQEGAGTPCRKEPQLEEA